MSLNAAQWLGLAPMLVLSATIVTVMLAIAYRRHHKFNATLAVTGLNLALLCCVPLLGAAPQAITPLLVVDGFSAFYTALVLVCALGTATLSHAYLDRYEGEREEMYLLICLSALGGMVLVSAQHLAALFIGLELLSVPLYAMVGYPVKQRHSIEAALKYLVLSASASAFLLLGMAFIYADGGRLDFAGIATQLAAAGRTPALVTGLALLVIGLGFKLSLVPFHLWTPDVYQGAPAPVATFLASASKTAVFAVLLRVFVQAGGYHVEAVISALAVLALASIVVGNLLAVRQDNVKRMLAYSSIAHFGYCLVALIAAGPLAVEAVGIYVLTYVVTTLGSFGVVTLVSSPMGDKDAEHISDYRGLFWRRPYLASILTVMLLSLAGIPMTAGFIGKFYVIAAGIEARLWVLLGAVVLGSAIGLYYYLRLLITLYGRDAELQRYDAEANWAQQTGGAMVLVMTLLMLAMGLYPQPFIQLVRLSGLTAG